jgi:hypothetical protein
MPALVKLYFEKRYSHMALFAASLVPAIFVQAYNKKAICENINMPNDKAHVFTKPIEKNFMMKLSILNVLNTLVTYYVHYVITGEIKPVQKKSPFLCSLTAVMSLLANYSLLYSNYIANYSAEKLGWLKDYYIINEMWNHAMNFSLYFSIQ